MASEEPILQTDLERYLPLLARGKVREIYTLDDSKLLFVATDRISAYDCIMKNGVPQKGSLLTKLSARWFEFLKSEIPALHTHFIELSIPDTLKQSVPERLVHQLQDRTMQVRRLKVFPIEAIVRGYVTGSAWKEYTEEGTIHGITVSGPGGRRLQESEKLEKPIYTPSTKAEPGSKDENIHPDQAAEIVGQPYAEQIEKLSLEIYIKASTYALSRGIIIADTKFEFGLDETSDQVVLVDEVLTPDSSRVWPADTYQAGRAQESLDKQYLRGKFSASLDVR
ncbi:Phosphoribosylaminoimidazole-succinocarboxamide synthase [Endocarpon pusillum Z07020]|uniref:Phosphoribosylaminoimidazole-succinocarboxamide synthase n=1 Tax=Endocarpon pusillum (strain Z07020 / HMAS-L-300199) TaxID=1263415 RepID=U1GBK8_ENDPU|nr:Phosphoribosylaminoimidazole-succinocarboxamide synthase [Endocarpon pusillum Z07020]ERF69438.1 Phosphoribosylaminoimidazole-succinocarboxamide synthase [Endocarpon pusillum Z07020]